ncbi:MAG: hypothetical protein WC794_05325 [Candidatus Doudnabacteria bacterium]|jgi:hypothetical protein
MSEEKKFDIREYAPIEWGWLVMLGILGMATLWLVGAVLLLRDIPVPNRHPLVVLFDVIVGVALVVGALCAGMAWTFTQNYWRRNVRGEVANFVLQGDRVEAFIDREVLPWHYQLKTFVWVVPLGGWWGKKQKLLINKAHSYHVANWESPCWNFQLVSAHDLSGNLCTVRIRLEDRYGSALHANLLRAFEYVSSHPRGDFDSVFLDHSVLQGRLIAENERVATAVRQLVGRLRAEHKRFANSQAGKAILLELEHTVLSGTQPV